jgi:hypothetical protein
VPGQKLPQHDAQGIHVGAGIGDLAARLFGGQVGRAPKHHAGLGVLFLQRAAGQAEVGQLHVAVVGQHDVGRGHVTVNQIQFAVGVHIEKGARHLARDVQGDFDGNAVAHAHAAIPHLAQVLALDHFHGDVEFESTWPASKVLTSPEWASRSTTLASSRKRLALPSSAFSGMTFLITHSLSNPSICPSAAT